MTWDDVSLPMKSRDAEAPELYEVPDTPPIEDAYHCVKKILDAKYVPADLNELCKNQEHLSLEEQKQLQTLLTKYEDLFDGTLGHWNGEDYDIELKPDVQPYHARPYPISKAYEQTLKKEVDRLCKLGVLKKVNRSQWQLLPSLFLKRTRLSILLAISAS